jgi:DNA-binding CsgD family transcriptional regulator
LRHDSLAVLRSDGVRRGLLLERAEELVALRAHIEEAAAGQGRLVVIEGPAGIGKTELLRATLGVARGRGLRLLTARGSEFESPVPFGVARQLFEPLLVRASAAEAAALLAGPASRAEPVLTGDADGGLGLDPADTEYRTLHAIYWLLVNAADRGPLLLAVDDAQWADRSSLRLLSFLERRVDGVPVMVLATIRSGDPEGELDDVRALLAGGRTRALRPRALSPAASGAVVRAGLGAEPPPEFVDACHRASGGNPYFLHELVAALRHSQVVPSAAATEDVLAFDPPAVARTVMHRLARLPDACGEVAAAAAVLGPEAERERLAALTGRSGAEVEEALTRLAAADLLRADGAEVEFVHPLVRTAIRGELAAGERGRLAAAAARELAAAGRVEQAAVHLLDAAPDGEEPVLDTLLEAARLAAARGASDVAARLLARALREPPPLARRVEVLCRLGVAEARLGSAAALETLSRAWQEAGSTVERAAVARDAAPAYVGLGRPADAAAVLEQASASLGPGELREALDLQRVELAGTMPQLRPPGPLLERVGSLAERDPVAGSVLHSYLGFEAMASGRPAAEALGHIERAVRGDVLADHGAGAWNARFRAAMMLGFCGEPERARQMFDDAAARARRRGAPLELSAALGLRGAMSYLLGDMRAAEADGLASLDLIPADAPMAPNYVPLLVDVLLERDRAEEAARALERARAIDALPDGLERPAVLAARGRVRIARGDLRAGRDDVLAAGERQDGAELRSPALGPWLPAAALATYALGERGPAVGLSAENLERSERSGAPFVHGRALRVHGIVLGGGEGLALLRDAVALLEPSYARLELAWAKTALGAALHENGEDCEARAQLRAAIELAERLGGEAVAARARDALVAAGGRPRRRLVTGPQALTPGEGRVAQAVAEGMSNRAAAQALFLSEKTIEAHLASVYRKLGVSSRVQLPVALAGADSAGVQDESGRAPNRTAGAKVRR